MGNNIDPAGKLPPTPKHPLSPLEHVDPKSSDTETQSKRSPMTTLAASGNLPASETPTPTVTSNLIGIPSRKRRRSSVSSDYRSDNSFNPHKRHTFAANEEMHAGDSTPKVPSQRQQTTLGYVKISKEEWLEQEQKRIAKIQDMHKDLEDLERLANERNAAAKRQKANEKQQRKRDRRRERDRAAVSTQEAIGMYTNTYL